MSFVNTVDIVGDEVLVSSIIDRSITEIADNLVTSIGQYAFDGCSALTTANFTVTTSIGQYAFYQCSNLTTADFPAATSIGGYVFCQCSKLTTADFPVATYIGESAFENCSSLTITDFPVVTSIGSNAFKSCTALTTANFPVVTSIGSNAFQNCSKLTTVDSPAAVRIGDKAFSSCSKLTTADFPVATYIGESAFSSCSSLTTTDFPVVTSIGSNAFYGCSNLTTVNFPVATSISSYVFDGCSNLTTANFPVATSIGVRAFADCYALTTVDFPAATSIGKNAFYGCSNLTTANFPVATRIEERAFNGCSKLTALILRSETMCTLSNTNAFDSTPIASGTGYIYVPAALVDSYKANSKWSTYANQIRAIEDYPEVCTSKNTWEGVIARMDAGTYATDYAIGDCIRLDLGSEGVINMQIAAFDADDLADGSGKAKISWISQTLLSPDFSGMNPKFVDNGDGTFQEGTGTIGGWEKCSARNRLKSAIKPLIPETVCNRLSPVTKTHTSFDTVATQVNQTTVDDVWIPSREEIRTLYSTLFPDDASRIKTASGYGARPWGLRSTTSYSSFHIVGSAGTFLSEKSENGYFVPLGFCTN